MCECTYRYMISEKNGMCILGIMKYTDDIQWNILLGDIEIENGLSISIFWL